MALCAAGIELAFGLVNHWTAASNRPPHGEMSVFTRYHPVLGWAGAPNVDDVLLSKRVRQNARGDRGRELPFAKPADRRRVVVLGDSQAWGLGAGEEETIAAQLETRLNAAGGPRWETVNLGVSGYGTDQAFLRYVLDGARYEPDVVVEIVFKNDQEENVSTTAWRVDKPRFDLDGGRLCLGNVPPPRVAGWGPPALDTTGSVGLLGLRIGLAWSETYRFFQKRSWRIAPRPDPSDLERLRAVVPCLGVPGDAYHGDGAAIMLALLERLDGLARGAGARFVTLFVPRPIECKHPQRDAYYAGVRSALEAAGLTSIDLRPYASTAGLGPDDMFMPKDSHLSVAGSALAAQALAQALR